MATYKRQRYLLMNTDPVHIGTGGYRLGRVDNSIVREPGTRVPKIPGTSMSGAIRAYAASQYGSLACAGQRDHCVQPTCPICYTFGYLRGEGDQIIASSGVVNLFDAHILLFPVHSMAGPVWVSTQERLRETGFTLQATSETDPPYDIPLQGGLYTWPREDPLNLGWLMLDPGQQISVSPPGKWQVNRWNAVKERIVLVHENLFSPVINSNLEIRTSVSIDPERGAAEEGALFTFEALPRATFLVNEVVLDDYRETFPTLERLRGWLRLDDSHLTDEERERLTRAGWTDEGVRETLGKLTQSNLTVSNSLDVVKAGLCLAEWLGVGGMGTRGFGRIAIVGEPVEQSWGKEAWE